MPLKQFIGLLLVPSLVADPATAAALNHPFSPTWEKTAQGRAMRNIFVNQALAPASAVEPHEPFSKAPVNLAQETFLQTGHSPVGLTLEEAIARSKGKSFKVRHQKYGEGVVTAVTDEHVMVKFGQEDDKKFARSAISPFLQVLTQFPESAASLETRPSLSLSDLIIEHSASPAPLTLDPARRPLLIMIHPVGREDILRNINAGAPAKIDRKDTLIAIDPPKPLDDFEFAKTKGHAFKSDIGELDDSWFKQRLKHGDVDIILVGTAWAACHYHAFDSIVMAYADELKTHPDRKITIYFPFKYIEDFDSRTSRALHGNIDNQILMYLELVDKKGLSFALDWGETHWRSRRNADVGHLRVIIAPDFPAAPNKPGMFPKNFLGAEHETPWWPILLRRMGFEKIEDVGNDSMFQMFVAGVAGGIEKAVALFDDFGNNRPVLPELALLFARYVLEKVQGRSDHLKQLTPKEEQYRLDLLEDWLSENYGYEAFSRMKGIAGHPEIEVRADVGKSWERKIRIQVVDSHDKEHSGAHYVLIQDHEGDVPVYVIQIQAKELRGGRIKSVLQHELIETAWLTLDYPEPDADKKAQEEEWPTSATPRYTPPANHRLGMENDEKSSPAAAAVTPEQQQIALLHKIASLLPESVVMEIIEHWGHVGFIVGRPGASQEEVKSLLALAHPAGIWQGVDTQTAQGETVKNLYFSVTVFQSVFPKAPDRAWERLPRQPGCASLQRAA